MTPRRHFLRRTQVGLVAFGLAFAGLAPSASAVTGDSEEPSATRATVADASAAREPTRAAASVIDAASEAAKSGSTALEASKASGDRSADRDADARGERSDSAGPTKSTGNEDGRSSVGRAADQSATLDEDREPSVERAIDRSMSGVRGQARSVAEKAATTVRPAGRRTTQTLREQAEAVVEEAHGNVEETVDTAATMLAATKPVIDNAHAIVGRAVHGAWGVAPSEPAPDAAHPATTAPATFESDSRVGGASREPLPEREAPGPVGLITELVERLAPMPATTPTAPPALRRRASADLRPSEGGLREYAASPQASATRAPVRLDPSDSASVAPLGQPGPSDGSPTALGGGVSSVSPMLGGAAATIAAFFLAAPSLLRRLRLSPALVRPATFVSLLDRPG